MMTTINFGAWALVAPVNDGTTIIDKQSKQISHSRVPFYNFFASPTRGSCSSDNSPMSLIVCVVPGGVVHVNENQTESADSVFSNVP